MSERLVLVARNPNSLIAGAVAAIADAAKIASAIIVTRNHHDVGFLSAEVQMGCKYFEQFTDS